MHATARRLKLLFSVIMIQGELTAWQGLRERESVMLNESYHHRIIIQTIPAKNDAHHCHTIHSKENVHFGTFVGHYYLH